MTELKIRSNYQARAVLCWHDLTDKERAEFDYLNSEQRQQGAKFVRYKAWVYDLNDMQDFQSVLCATYR